MIKLLKKSKIDIAKYDTCIQEDKGTQVYAYSWYLDIVTDDWSCLVFGDYEVVMPIPYMRALRNFMMKKIMQPIFCQQLGLYSRSLISQELYEKFYQAFLRLSPRSYSFNSNNKELEPSEISKVVFKVNYELNLGAKYELTKGGYSNNLLRNVKKAKRNGLIIKNNTLVLDLIVLKMDAAKTGWSRSMSLIGQKLLNALIEKNLGKLYWVYDAEELVAGAFFIETSDRLVHLMSYSSDHGRKVGAIPFLFDSIIKDNSSSDMVFDFEGSMIPGVARFFKSFGALPQQYLTYSK